MALTKQAILELKITGFAEAEAAAKRIAGALTAMQQVAGRAAAVSASAFQRAGQAAGGVAGAVRAIGTNAISAAAAARSSMGKTVATLTAIERAAKAAGTAVGGVGNPGSRRGTSGGSGQSVGAVAGNVLGAVGGGELGKAGAALSALGPEAAVAAAAIGAVVAGLYAAGTAGEKLFSSMQRGERLRASASAFAELAKSTGGAATTLAALERATGGAVSQNDLMLASNRLLGAGLDMSRERMEKLFHASAILAKVQGISTVDAINRVSMALAKQEPELIDELGLKVDLTKAVKEYAAAHGMAVEEVDALTRGQIFAAKVEEQAIQKTRALGGAVGPLGTVTEQVSARWQNFMDRIDKFVAQQPGFAKALESTATAAMKILEALTPLIELAGKVAAALAPVIEKVGELGAVMGRAPGATLAAAGAAMGPAGLPLVVGGAVLDTALYATGATGKGGAGGSGWSPSAAAASRGGTMVSLDPTSAAAVGRAVAVELAAILRGRASFGDLASANSFGG